MKCIAKGFSCPGYENTIDRLFQDESSHVEQKAKTAKAKAIALRDKKHEQEEWDRALTKALRPGSIETPIFGPLIDHGLNFFMSYYALGIYRPPLQSEAYSSHLATHGFHPIVATAMTALGLSGISNIYMDKNFKDESMQWYTKALRLTNAALASPTEAKRDTTLLATMLLSMFEATSNEKSLSGWSNHVQGSASLIRMRGIQQFSTAAGRWMYPQIASLLTMNCMGRGEPVPDFIHEMNKESIKYEDSTHPGNKFFHLHIDVIDLRAKIRGGHITALQEIIDAALKIDGIAKITFDECDPSFLYERVFVEENTPNVFSNYYDIYEHMQAAQTWNWVRYNRIYLHDIIRNCLIVGYSASPPVFVGIKYIRLLEESSQILYQMQGDILASMPQHLFDTPKSPMPYLSPPQLGSDSSPITMPPGTPKFLWSNFNQMPITRTEDGPDGTQLPILRTAGGYSAVWALYVAGSTPIASSESQNFVLRTLDRIAVEFGINQAKVLGTALKYKILLDQTGEQPFEIVPSYLPKVQPPDS
ncbi:hypothetical protein B0J11DRAFT_438278 [Dendryphion nanum]|uniref:Uncharacterized protein n=1 Tax=Dendryphion nanum TaxID=256645 RepID=A0A9P9DK24_9PLEO|nr:hypothetical protein B0J11DRAFT_438278 [Dendryphion nanum]